MTVSYVVVETGSGIDDANSDTDADVLSEDGANLSASGNVTDLAGNTASATADGINIDKTAPVITAPSDQVVIATSDSGAAVNFSVSADASVSGLASLGSYPASGDTFPVATTTVTHTAEDLAGNVSVATHEVTVLGAQGLKARAAKTLEPFSDESKRIEKAINEIAKSLEKGFLDETHLDSKHGKKVFDHEKRAAKELLHLLKDEAKGKDRVSDGAEGAARAAIGDLVAADVLLAQVALDEANAIDQGSLDAKTAKKVAHEIEKSNNELVKAEKELDEGHDDHAIDKFKKAWEHAQRAIKHAAE